MQTRASRADLKHRLRHSIWVPADVEDEQEPDVEPPAQTDEEISDRLYRLRHERLRCSNARPSSPHEIIGQDEALERVRVILSGEEPTHMILTGPPGVGKTSVARIAMTLAQGSSACAFDEDSPFVEVDATTLPYRSDFNFSPLTTWVAEAYYESVQRRSKYKDCPEIMFGATARAHMGILFVDEIGELPYAVLNTLLKVLEDGRELLTCDTWNAASPHAPDWMRHFFEHGVPADFVLIGATTSSPAELPPALVSRCELVPFRTLSRNDLIDIAHQVSSKVGIEVSAKAAHLLGSTCQSGREISRRLQIARARASARGSEVVDVADVPNSGNDRRAGFRA